MGKYFSNPEIKISSVTLIFILAVFFGITSLIVKNNYDNLKEEYATNIGSIANRVIEKDPSLEKEIMPLILKETSPVEASKGKEFINSYGLNKNLDNSLFPYINDSYNTNILEILIAFVFIGILLFLLNYIQNGFFYNKVRKLTIAAYRVVEGDYDLSINESREGDFSKLSVAFNSMRGVIRNNISELKKDKQFLVDLLSDISHQLKTPLSALILYNDIMLSKDLSRDLSKAEQENFLSNGRTQLFKMNWLIQNILKLAKLDAKAIELNKEVQSLGDTIEESIAALDSRYLQANVTINFSNDEDIVLLHDRLWFEEALINIIKNAIEHTPSGGAITIELSENPIYKKITISDNGEGISPEDLPNIFKRFYKAKTLKNSDSIGIGLALAKAIVEAHGGMIDVESKLQVGTRFTLTFLKY